MAKITLKEVGDDTFLLDIRAEDTDELDAVDQLAKAVVGNNRQMELAGMSTDGGRVSQLSCLLKSTSKE